MEQMISADWLSEAKEKQGNAWSMTRQSNISGGDAYRGHTRSHLEHDG